MAHMTFDRFDATECTRSIEFATTALKIGLRNLSKPAMKLAMSKYRYAKNSAIACNGSEFASLAALRPAAQFTSTDYVAIRFNRALSI